MAGELGTVVFLHGFPEIWYSWRHQMLAVAAAGYRAIAPDCRGYGLSDQPPENEEDSWVWDDLVADVLSILDALSIPKVRNGSDERSDHCSSKMEILLMSMPSKECLSIYPLSGIFYPQFFV